MNIRKYVLHPATAWYVLDRKGNLPIFLRMPDQKFLGMLYEEVFHQKMDFKTPKTFNEKIQWLKVYDRNPKYPKLADKAEVKKHVAKIIGEEYVIPTIGVYESFDDINFDSLPKQFVLKCTHDSGGIVICKDKDTLNLTDARKKLEDGLKQNFYWPMREWVYKDIQPRIIIEKFLPEVDGDTIDYKFMCFNGKVEYIFTGSERFSEDGLKITWFTPEWKKLDFERHYPASKKNIPKPKNLQKMIEIAEQLSKGIPFVRIDLYNLNGKIYFGEYTFYPGAGLEEFTPEEWDYKLGNLIKLPQKQRGNK